MARLWDSDRFAALMRERGLSDEELSTRLRDVSSDTVKHWRLVEGPSSLKMVIRVAGLLGVETYHIRGSGTVGRETFQCAEGRWYTRTHIGGEVVHVHGPFASQNAAIADDVARYGRTTESVPTVFSEPSDA